MSELVMCKGCKNNHSTVGIKVTELDPFLQECAFKIWGKVDDVWTIQIKGKDIDSYLTKAQSEINSGKTFEDTEFYLIMEELLNWGVEIAMWYDIFYEDLPLCKTSKEVMDACYNGIMDISGMCEVYFVRAK